MHVVDLIPVAEQKIQLNAPGIIAAGGVAALGFAGAEMLGQQLLAYQGIAGASASPISGIPVSILLGLGANNVLTLPASLKPGIALATTTVLRAGIICKKL